MYEGVDQDEQYERLGLWRLGSIDCRVEVVHSSQ